MANTKPVKLPSEVVSVLEEIKSTLGLRSLGDAAKVLTDLSFSPISVVGLMLDMRSDVKELLKEIKRLNENLEKFMDLVVNQNT